MLVRYNERKQSHSLACARRHFQHAMTPRIKGAFEVAHVRILLRVYARIREEDLKFATRG